MNNLTTNLTRKFKLAGLQLKKYSPEILVVAGVVGTVASAVMACKATTKLNDILVKAKQDVEVIHDAIEHPETLPGEYTPEDGRKDLTIVYTQTGLKLIKLYGPSLALGTLSIASILTSSNILRKRNMALAAAYTVIDKSFKQYRGRVVERFGEALDKELRFNVKAKEVDEIIVDKNGKEKTVKKTINVSDPNDYSDYARCFDDGCTGWDKDSEVNLLFLKHQQNYANELLRSNGYLFLNDVYDMLGIPRTKAGQVVGWIYDEDNPNHKGDNFVDFGIYDLHRQANRDFVNGYERVIWLDFNVDGNILDLI